MKKHEKTHQKILESALEIFLTHGYANTSVPMIVKEASIAQGTFYRYFTEKKECFNCLIKKLLSAFTTEMNAALNAPKKGNVIDILNDAIKVIRQNKDLLRLLHLEYALIDPVFLESLHFHRVTLNNYCKTLLEEGGDTDARSTFKVSLFSNLIDSIILNEVVFNPPSSFQPNLDVEKQLELIATL